jgi:hypothetical protein
MSFNAKKKTTKMYTKWQKWIELEKIQAHN